MTEGECKIIFIMNIGKFLRAYECMDPERPRISTQRESSIKNAKRESVSLKYKYTTVRVAFYPSFPPANSEHLLHPTQHARLGHIGHVDKDIISGMTVQRCTESLLVKMVSDKPDAAAEHEQAVQRADLDVFIGLFRCKSTAVTQEINKADSNAAVDVENELHKGMTDQHKMNDERV
jgi:hypothetical protein